MKSNKSVKYIYVLIVSSSLFFSLGCSNKNCDCVKELSDYRNYNRYAYNNCIDIAMKNGSMDPLNYHKGKCK